MCQTVWRTNRGAFNDTVVWHVVHPIMVVTVSAHPVEGRLPGSVIMPICKSGTIYFG